MEEKTLTIKDAESLSDFTGFDLEATFLYTPKAFRAKMDKNFWPVFTLKSKSGLDLARIEDKQGYIEYEKDGTRHIIMQSGSHRVETLRCALVAVKKFPFEGGAVLSWNNADEKAILTRDGKSETRTMTVDNVIDRLKIKLQTELQNAINERSVMSEEELRGLE